MAKKYPDKELKEIEQQFRDLIEDQEIVYIISDPSMATRRSLVNALKKEACENIIDVDSCNEALLEAKAAEGTVVAIAEIKPKAKPREIGGIEFLGKFMLDDKLSAKGKVLLIGGKVDKEDLVKAIKCGAAAFMKKPVTPESFIEKLKELELL